jgi:hypothetical protein
VLSKILQFAFCIRKTGYRNSTVQTRVRALKGPARRTNLLDTESVKSYLANTELSENRKTKLLEDVSCFYAYLKIPFIRPRYQRIEVLPFIPLESEINQLVVRVGSPMNPTSERTISSVEFDGGRKIRSTSDLPQGRDPTDFGSSQ